MTNCQTQKTERGFTLVELAIVLIIVGLLIGGILKGQELIQNARITATVSQIKGFEAAANTFRDSFNTLPGDLPAPGTRLPNCAGSCVPGTITANGRIDQNPGAALANEGLAVFPQLAAADLISGANPTPTAGAPFIGDETPQTEIGGSGFIMGNATATSTATTLNNVGNLQAGVYVTMNVDPNAVLTTTASTNVMKPTDAAKVDNKIDDGLPNQGTVRLAGAADCVATGTSGVTAAYGNVTTNNCTVFVRIQ